MAGDWIKMRTDLYRDPKVIVMADQLLKQDGDLASYVNQNLQCDMSVTRNVMRNAIVGALVSVWGVARHQGRRENDDLRIDNVGLPVIDDIADMPGFGDAMSSVGWVVVTTQGLCFPRFYESHNVDPLECQKEKNKERQRRFRERHNNVESNVTDNVTVTHRVEKSREEKSNTNTPPKPPKGECAEFEQFWKDFPSYRKQGKAAARKAWESAIKKTTPEEILSAVKEYAASPVGKGQYVKGPAPWLNQECWKDDRAAWQRQDDAKSGTTNGVYVDPVKSWEEYRRKTNPELFENAS